MKAGLWVLLLGAVLFITPSLLAFGWDFNSGNNLTNGSDPVVTLARHHGHYRYYDGGGYYRGYRDYDYGYRPYYYRPYRYYYYTPRPYYYSYPDYGYYYYYPY